MTLNVSSDSLAQITGGTASGKFGGGGGMPPGTDGQILVTTAGQPTWTTPDYVVSPDLTTALGLHPTKTELTTTLGTYVTKTELGTELAPLVSGMQHGASVLDFANAPDANAASGSFYVVGSAPTGAFAGQAGAVAFLEGTTWKFTAPQKNEAHLNEKDNTIYHWSGTQWNKVGTVTPQVIDNLVDVDTTKTAPVVNDLLTFDGKVWVPSQTTRFPIVVAKKVVSGNARGEIIRFNAVPVLHNHGYRITGCSLAVYDNEHDRFRFSIRENNQPLVHFFNNTLGGIYRSTVVGQLMTVPPADGHYAWSLQLEGADAGVVLERSWLTVEDLGPMP